MKKIEDIDIIFIWRIFKKHWHWISLTAAVSAISTYLICVFLISPVYKAEISLFAWDEKNKKPAFLQGSNPRPVAESPANDANYGISIHDINLGTQLVNDYKELINSRYVLDKVTSILEQKLPADKNVDFTFVAMLPRQTRFMRVAVYSKSSVKAELAAAVIAEVFIDSVNELMNIKRVQVVDKAKIIGIVSPKTKVTTIIAFVIGGGAMFLIFLAYAFFHHTLHDSSVVTSELKLPTIGKISEISGDGNEKLACLPDQNQQYRFNYAVEDFLLLQTNLFYSLVQKNSAQILLLTSATAKEGKPLSASILV
ncbi:MAG: Wzz/FepE/Etk N-terminal domain-containing protein [Victivallaceae bacterium]|nr:Wzz/FepE/Etk N-terminal domain-containing protein [Victivallaceae bacterium]